MPQIFKALATITAWILWISGLISSDMCKKHRLRSYGGPGYAHILENIVPLMKEKGISENNIHSILLENPKKLLKFV